MISLAGGYTTICSSLTFTRTVLVRRGSRRSLCHIDVLHYIQLGQCLALKVELTMKSMQLLSKGTTFAETFGGKAYDQQLYLAIMAKYESLRTYFKFSVTGTVAMFSALYQQATCTVTLSEYHTP